MSGHNLTTTEIQTDSHQQLANYALLKVQQEQFVRYLAIGGLITEESDLASQVQNIHQMTVTQFCEAIGISRDTFYRWKKTIPGLGQMVREKRDELFGLNRETALHNRAYLIAMTSNDHKAAGEMIKMLLGNSGKLELPVQRTENKEVGESWAALVEKKQREVIEAEIINDPQVKEHDRPTDNN